LSDDRGDHLTTAQAAAQLGVAPNSVMAWADAGLLRSWRTPGGHRRISAASVRAMLAERECRTALARTRQIRVLLVEDNPDTTAVLSSHLGHILPHGELRVARDGFQALVEVGRDEPDLLITDVNLPGMNGLAMLGSLNLRSAARRMHFVLVTNYLRHELDAFGQVPPGVPLLTKPVSREALREAVTGALGACKPTP
jgi:excisionase family DNA binding protein